MVPKKMERNKTDDWRKIKTDQLARDQSLFRQAKKKDTEVQAKRTITGERRGAKRLTVDVPKLGDIENFSDEANLSEKDQGKE